MWNKNLYFSKAGYDFLSILVGFAFWFNFWSVMTRVQFVVFFIFICVIYVCVLVLLVFELVDGCFFLHLHPCLCSPLQHPGSQSHGPTLHHLHVSFCLSQSIKLNPCLGWLTNDWWAHIAMTLFNFQHALFLLLLLQLKRVKLDQKWPKMINFVSLIPILLFSLSIFTCLLLILSVTPHTPFPSSVLKWMANRSANWVTVSKHIVLIPIRNPGTDAATPDSSLPLSAKSTSCNRKMCQQDLFLLENQNYFYKVRLSYFLWASQTEIHKKEELTSAFFFYLLNLNCY